MQAHAQLIQGFLCLVKGVGVGGGGIAFGRLAEALQAHHAGVELLQVARLQRGAGALQRLADPLQVQSGVHGQVHHPVQVHVLAGVGEGLLLQAVHLGGGEAVGGHHLQAGALATAALGGADRQHAVGVHGELHLQLGNAGGHGRQALQFEAADAAAVGHHLALALQHMDHDAGLVVHRGGEGFGGAGGNAGVLHDQLGHRAAAGFHAKAERNHVKQQVAATTHENVRLHRGAQRHHLIGVQRGVGRKARQRGHGGAHGGHARAATHHHHPVKRGVAGVGQSGAELGQRALDQRRGHGFQCGARECASKRAAAAQVDLDGRGVAIAQRDLGALGEGSQRLQHAGRGCEWAEGGRGLRQQPLHHHAVDVVTAQARVAVGGQHLKQVAGGVHLVGLDAQDRDIEGAAAEVVNGNGFGLARAVQAIGQRRGRGLVHDALGQQARQARGVARGLTLRVVKVGGHGDHRAAHGVAKGGFGGRFQLRQHQRGHFLRRDGAARSQEGGDAARALHQLATKALGNGKAFGVAAPHEALAAGDGFKRKLDRVVARGVAHHGRGAGHHAHHAWQQGAALRIGQHARPGLGADGHQRVGGAKIDAHDGVGHGGDRSGVANGRPSAAVHVAARHSCGQCPLSNS